MSEPAFLPSNTHAHAHTTKHFLRGNSGGTTLTRHHTSSSSNTRGGIGRRQASGVIGVNCNNNQEAVTPLIPAVPHQPVTKRLHILKDVVQQQQQQSGSAIPRVPATSGHIHELPNDNSNNGSQTESTTTAPSNPWLFIPHAPQPGPTTVSNGEGALYPTPFDTQQPPQQQQQQNRRQLPFNSLPAPATATAGTLTRKRTNSASSTSTTSVTYLRNAAAAFIATAHQNHFQFPHKVLHPEIQPLSTANLDLQHDFDGEDDDESFTSRELQSSLPRDVGAKVMGGGGGIRGGIEQEFMTEDDDDQLEDDRGRGFGSTTPPLDLGQIVNSEETFWRRRNQYNPILFPSTTATTTDAAVDAIASSDTPLFPLSSYRPSPHITTTTNQLNSNNLQGYWSTETEEADQDRFLPSGQDHLPSTDHHIYHNHHQRQERKPHQRQMYLFGRQDSTINNPHMQDRSTSYYTPPDNYYAYQKEVISVDPSSPLPPPSLYFPSTTSFASTNNQRHPARRTDDASEFVESADRASWVSDLSSAGDRNHSKQQQQQQPHGHPVSLFSPMGGGNNGSEPGGQAPPSWQDSRSEQDREVFEVCNRRLQLGYTPSQNIHKALVGSIRSSFLASLSGSQRASLMNGDSSGVQQSTPGDEDLQDFQQPWYQPQHLPYYASPDQEYASRSFEKEARQRREEELLEVIAQLEKDLQELHSSTVELQTRLLESEERNERMVLEHDCTLRRVKEEYDHQIHDTKKRTKRFFDETMRKRQRDEDKRLEGIQEQLAQTQAANKDLWTTIRGLQRERLDAEQDQRDDLSVLCLFIENVMNSMVFDFVGCRDGDGVTQLQSVGTFECRRPSTINTATTAIAKGNLYDYDLTPTTSVPHPVPIALPTPSSQDNSPPKATTTTTTGQCTSPRGQKCMSLLEQLQSALSIFFANATAVTTPTTPHNLDKASSIPHPAAGGLQQEESPKTLAPFRKTHSRHTCTATNSTTTTTTTATTKHGRHDALTEDHLVRLHETGRLEGLNSRWARKQSSDSSSASSGHTIVTPAFPPMPFRQVVVSNISSTPTTAAVTPPPPPATVPRVPSASEKLPASDSISTPNSAINTAVSRPQKHTPLTTTTTTSLSPTTTKAKSKNTIDTKEKKGKEKETEKEKEKEKGKGKGKEKEKEKKDRSLQQCLAEQHTRYQKEIERIKQQCINIYRQSLEDVRADMKFKLGQAGRGGQIRRARSTTAATAAPVVATATAH